MNTLALDSGAAGAAAAEARLPINKRIASKNAQNVFAENSIRLAGLGVLILNASSLIQGIL